MMSLEAIVGLILVTTLVGIGTVYLAVQADKRRKAKQRKEKTAKKAVVAANRAAWQKWRNKQKKYR